MLEVIGAFGRKCNEIIAADPGGEGLEKIRVLLEEELLQNEEVIATYLRSDDTPDRNVLYEDKDYGFCIVAHNYPGPRQGRVHDHGPAWAIYGQVIGSIEMTEYDVVEPPQDGAPGKVRPVKSYVLEPGHAVVYPKGRVHAPKFPTDVRVIRIEGRNLEGVRRDKFESV